MGDGMLPRLVRETFDKIAVADEKLEFTIKTSCFEVATDMTVNDLASGIL
jgi:hypothetical protein